MVLNDCRISLAKFYRISSSFLDTSAAKATMKLRNTYMSECTCAVRKNCIIANGNSFPVDHRSAPGIIDVIKCTTLGFFQIGITFDTVLIPASPITP